jgi:hypothetical protein
MENHIESLYKANIRRAQKNLMEIPVFCGDPPQFSGLNGWVFEKTIQHLILKHLRQRRINATIREQVPPSGRVRADLTINNIALEIKAGGLFSSDAPHRYKEYQSLAKKKGLRYIYLTLGETYQPYRKAIIKALGGNNAFFLDTAGEWKRFTTRLVAALKKQ